MPNRLAHETSPYLQQHAGNPVDWYPWGEEALRRAREENKPILLSVGYSACHWCHVMAHESFEDPAVAAVMNRHFVNVKVDREERPDLDQIYQTAHQMLTQRAGGWPLTMFLTPDQKPFFGGTYFPKAARYNLPGFVDLLERVAQLYGEQAEAIRQQNDELVELLGRSVPSAPEPAVPQDDTLVQQALQELQDAFDPEHGGLGNAPKFPHPAELELALRQGQRRNAAGITRIGLLTLERMALGGIYDQLGGGFCRYSVDQAWTIPHFEKMLYDNGPLLGLYADAWRVTGNPLFAAVCEETVGWALREMQAPEGGFYSSLDADSEHEEGKFYVWSRAEAAGSLDAEEYRVAAAVFGLDGPPNFEGRHWHLRVARPLATVAAAQGRTEEAARALLESARAKLFAVRARRVRPGRDDKILTSWNALMVRGLCRAGRVLDRPDWIRAAARAVEFLQTRMLHEGALLATYKDGRAHLNAYLDDHAYLLAAVLELLQADFSVRQLDFARQLGDALLQRFEDRQSGGFFFTSHDHEPLIVRTKPGHDNATPSGNGVAAASLQLLGHLVGDARYLDAAERTVRLFLPQLRRHPSAFASLLGALEQHSGPPTVVVLRGPAEATRAWRRTLDVRYVPGLVMLAIEPATAGLPEALDKPAAAGVNAWVCRGVTCLPPITELRVLAETLAQAA